MAMENIKSEKAMKADIRFLEVERVQRMEESFVMASHDEKFNLSETKEDEIALELQGD